MATYQSNPGNYPPNQQGYPQQGYGQQPQVQQNTVVVVQTKTFPTLTPCSAVVVLILNIFFPGVGTMIMGCMAGGDATCTWICNGFVQLILAPCIVGWIWAIVTGCQAIANSKPNGDQTVVVSGHGGNHVVVA